MTNGQESQHGHEGTENPSPNASEPDTTEHGIAEGRTTETPNSEVPDEARKDVAERPGHTSVDPDHADEVADTWGEESFPASDPPSHY